MSGIRSVGASPTRFLNEESNPLFKKFGNKGNTNPLGNSVDKEGTQKIFAGAELKSQRSKAADLAATFSSSSNSRREWERDLPRMISGESPRIILNSERSPRVLGEMSIQERGSRANLKTERVQQESCKQFKNDIAKKKIEYFTASARNFMQSALNLKKLIQHQKSNEVAYALNIFQIDLDNMEKSLRHLESEAGSLATQTLLINGRSQESGVGQIIDSLRKENDELQCKMQNNPVQNTRQNFELAKRYEEEIQILRERAEKAERQFQKQERKCQDRKECIQKLYNLVEEKEKEQDELQERLEALQRQMQMLGQQAKQSEMEAELLEKKLFDTQQLNTELHLQRKSKEEIMEELRSQIIDTQTKMKVQCREDNPSILTRWRAIRDALTDRQKIVSMQKEELEAEQRNLREELFKEKERVRNLEERITGYITQIKKDSGKERELDEIRFSKDQIEKRAQEAQTHYQNMLKKLEEELKKVSEESNSQRMEWVEYKERMDSERIEYQCAEERKNSECQLSWERRLQQCSEEWGKQVEERESVIAQKKKEGEIVARQLAQSERRRVEAEERIESKIVEQERREQEFDSISQEMKRKIGQLQDELAEKKAALKAQQLATQEALEELSLRKNAGQQLSAQEQQDKERIAALKARIVNYEQDNADLRREKDDLKERISALDASCSETKRVLSKIQEDLKNAQELRQQVQLNSLNDASKAKKQVETIKTELIEAENNIKLKEAALQTSKAELLEARNAIQQMKLESLKVSHKVQQQEDEIAAAKELIKEQTKKIEERQKQLEEIRGARTISEEQFKRREKELLNELKTVTNQLAVALKEATQAKQSIDEIKEELEMTQTQSREKELLLEQQLSKAKDNLADKQVQLEQLIETSAALESELLQAGEIGDKLRKEVVILNNQINSMHSTNTELQSIVEDLNKNNAEAKDIHTEAFLQAQRVEMNRVVLQKEEECLKLQRSLLESETATDKTRRALEDLERQSELQNMKLKDQLVRIASLEDQLSTASDKIKKAADLERRTNIELTNLKDSNSKLNNHIETLEQDLQREKQTNTEYKALNDELLEKSRIIQRETEQLNQQLNEFKAQNASLEQRAQQLSEAKETLSRDNLELKQQKVQVEMQLQKEKSTNERINERITKIEEENKELKINKFALEEETINLNEQLKEKERESQQIISQQEKTIERLKSSLENINNSKKAKQDLAGEQGDNNYQELLKVQEELDSQIRQNKQLTDGLALSEAKLLAIQKKSQYLEEENEAQKKTINQERADKVKCEDQLRDLSAQNAVLSEKEKAQRDELVKLRESMIVLSKEKNQLAIELEAGNSTNKAKEAEKDLEIAEITRELSRTARQLEEKKADVVRLLQNLKEQKELHESVQEKLNKTASESQFLQETQQAEQDKKRELQEKNRELQLKQDILSVTHEQLKSEKASLQAQLEHHMKNTSQLQQTHKEQMEQQEKSFIQRETEWQELLQQTRTMNETLNEDNKEKTNAITQLKAKISSLSEINPNSDSQLNIQNKKQESNPNNKEDNQENYEEEFEFVGMNKSRRDIEVKAQIKDINTDLNKSLNENNSFGANNSFNQDLNKIKKDQDQKQEEEINQKVLSQGNILTNQNERHKNHQIAQNKETVNNHNIEDMVIQTNQINPLKEENERLEGSLLQANEQLKEKIKEIEWLEEQIKQHTYDGEQAVLKQHNLENKIEEMSKSYSQLLEQLEEAKNNHQQEIYSMKEEIQGQQVQHEGLQEQHSVKEQQLNEQIVELEQQVNQLQGQIEEQNKLHQDTKEINSAANTQNQLLLNQLSNEKQRIQKELETEKKNKIEEIDNLEEKNKLIVSEFEEYKQEMERQQKELQDEIQELNETISGQTELIENYKKLQKQKETNEREQRKQKDSEERETFKNQISVLNQEKKKFQKQIDILQKENASSLKDIQDLEERIKAMEEEIKLAERQNDQQAQTLSALQDKIETDAGHIEQLEAEKIEQKKLCDQLEGNLETKRKQIEKQDDAHKERENRLNKELQSKCEYIATLENTHKDKQELASVQNQQNLKELKEEVNYLNSQLEQSKMECLELETQKRQNKEQQQIIKEINQEKDRLEMELQQLEDDLHYSKLGQQDLSIKVEVLQMKAKNYFPILAKILLAIDPSLNQDDNNEEDKLNPQTHSLEDLLSLGLTLAKSLKQSREQSEETLEVQQNLQQNVIYSNLLEKLLNKIIDAPKNNLEDIVLQTLNPPLSSKFALIQMKVQAFLNSLETVHKRQQGNKDSIRASSSFNNSDDSNHSQELEQ